MARPKKNAKDKKEPQLHEELKGLDITVDKLGEISSTLKMDQLNDFLNKRIEDKKLVNRDDWDEISGKEKPSKAKKKK